MERKGRQLVLVLLTAVFTGVNASPGLRIYKAYITGNMMAWKEVTDSMIQAGPKDNGELLELTNYEYGYIGWCVGNKRYGEARRYLDRAERNLEILIKDPVHHSMVNSYKSAFYGYRIGMNILAAPILGMKSIESAKLAVEQDESNAFAYVQKGNIEFYMPPVFGGSKEEALRHYLKALELMERDPEDLRENWNYLSLLILIAQSYSYINDFQSAVNYLDRLLAIEPRFNYVKNELYPLIINRMRK